jgi:hypothetical protein
MRYDVHPDGTLSNGQVFFDATSEPGEDAWDGMKIDVKGNLYLSGPGGLWIISPEGKQLGMIVGADAPGIGDDGSLRPNQIFAVSLPKSAYHLNNKKPS